MTQKSNKRPLMILLSSLMGLEQDYNDKMHAGNAVFFNKYTEEQASKAYALYSKLLREKVKNGEIMAAFADQKFLIEVKEVKDRDTKEVKEKAVYIQELLIFSNPVFEQVNKALISKVQAEIPFEKPKLKGPGANSESVVKLEDAETISYDDFVRKAKEAQEKLQAFSKRGKALGSKNKKAPEPEPEPVKVKDEMPFANKVGGKKITGGTKTKDAPVYEPEPEPETVTDPADMFAERLEAIEKIGIRIKKVQKIVDLDEDDDDAALLLAKLLKKQKRLIKEKEELEELLKDDDDDDDFDSDSDSDFSDLDDSDDDDDDMPAVKPKPEPKKASKPKPEPKPEPKKANIQPEKVRRSRPKI